MSDMPAHPLVAGSRIARLRGVAGGDRTVTNPASESPGVFSGKNLVVSARIEGVEGEFLLPASMMEFWLGRDAETCQIWVDRADVSRQHAHLARIADSNRLEVIDRSKNGIVLLGEVVSRIIVGPGEAFSVQGLNFYLLSEAMRNARPVIAEVLGQRASVVDQVMIEATKGTHILLTGERGCDQERLARAIHSASLLRTRHFVALSSSSLCGPIDPAVIKRAAGGTVLVPLPHGSGLRLEWIDALLAQTARLVICAQSFRSARERLSDDLVRRCNEVVLTPLRERLGDVMPLMERWFYERGGTITMGSLSVATRDKLLRYRWPKNLEELRDSSEFISILAPYVSEREAARGTGITRSKIRRWLDKLSLTLPLTTKAH